MTVQTNALKDPVTKDAVTKVLSEPFKADFPESVRKMRTHLMIASFVGLMAGWHQARINLGTPIFGIYLEGLDSRDFLWGLLLIVFYLFAHFLWSSIEICAEWMLRRTGTKALLDAPDAFLHPRIFNDGDGRHETLYRWWLSQANAYPVSEALNYASNLSNDLELHSTFLKESHILDDPFMQAQLNPKISNMRDKTDKIIQHLKVEALRDGWHPELAERLLRFDNRFKDFLSWQQRRWLVIELGLPTAMGIVALIALSYRLWAGFTT